MNYVNKLVLFPRDEKTPVTKAKSGILNDTPKVNNFFIFRKIKKLLLLQLLMHFLLLLRELDLFPNFNFKDLPKLEFIDHLDKNGTIKEMKEEDSKRKEKLLRKTDLLKYLNVSPFTLYCFTLLNLITYKHHCFFINLTEIRSDIRLMKLNKWKKYCIFLYNWNKLNLWYDMDLTP